MEIRADRSAVNRTIMLFALTYMVSYMTRINFGAVISAVVEQTMLSKRLLSGAVTCSAITYGLGQILCGYIGDRVSPKRLVFLGLMLSAAMNLAMPFCPGPGWMTAVWGVNGLAQACLWPPMVKLMVALFSEEDYRRASTTVSWGSSFGTIIIYLISPVIILAADWRLLFFITALCAVFMAAVWMRCCREPDFGKPDPRQQPRQRGRVGFLSPLLLAIMAAIVLQGALRDGVTTWMPSLISESFALSSEVSILSGVCLPVFSILSFRVALGLYNRFPGNPVRCAAWLFAVGAVAALVLTGVCAGSALASAACMAVLTGSMHGVNLMLICMVPPYFSRHGGVSTVSGVLNSCTYVGSAISTYGIALLSEQAGWQVTALVWFAIALAGTVVCFVCGRIWK